MDVRPWVLGSLPRCLGNLLSLPSPVKQCSCSLCVCFWKVGYVGYVSSATVLLSSDRLEDDEYRLRIDGVLGEFAHPAPGTGNKANPGSPDGRTPHLRLEMFALET